MSRNFIPAALAIGVGVFTGYYTFQPTFQQLAIKRAYGGQSPAAGQSHNGANAPADAVPAAAGKSAAIDSRPEADKSK